MRAKKVNNRPGYRPMLVDFEYDSLQQYPDNIQLLYRDDYYNQYSDIFNVVEIITVNTILKEYFFC
nr:DnaB-like helicase C-terminal domain-containing protein [uncultured Clostridium sp.]